jgi:predicted nuclease of predicted toxin-antitoxin system
VRILLDQNLSPKLIRKLADVLPGLESVYDYGLTGASDPFIFDWARRSEFSGLISTDRDFVHLAERLGPPPKVIRIERCDYPAAAIEQSASSPGATHSRFSGIESIRAAAELVAFAPIDSGTSIAMTLCDVAMFARFPLLARLLLWTGAAILWLIVTPAVVA